MPKFANREALEASSEMFGREFKVLRKKTGLSQRGVGTIFGINHTNIAKIEMGRRSPPMTPYFYRKLLDLPNITTNDIIRLLSTILPLTTWKGDVKGTTLTPVDGVDINIMVNPEKINSGLLEVIKAEVSLSVRSTVERALERNQRIDVLLDLQENSKLIT